MGSGNNVLQKITDQIVNPVIGVLFGIAVLIFLWGVLEFMAQAENEEARTTGKKHMIWGIAGLVIMVGVAGIIRILQSFFESGVGIGGGFAT